MPTCFCNCTVCVSFLMFVYVWAHLCVWVCVKYDCVFPQHMVIDHSSHTGSEMLTVGWIVSVLHTTHDRTFCAHMCTLYMMIQDLTPDSFFSQGRQKLARFNAREFATLIIDILSDAKRRQQGKGLSSPTGETLGRRDKHIRTESNFKAFYGIAKNLLQI